MATYNKFYAIIIPLQRLCIHDFRVCYCSLFYSMSTLQIYNPRFQIPP